MKEKELNEEMQKVKEPFLTKETGFINKTKEPVHELKEYVLFLIKNNGHTDIIEGVQAGEFYLKSSDGKQEKGILLTPNKLTTINYNKQYFKGWIAHEDNMSPYPEDPIHNAEMYRKTSQKIAMNYKDANEAKALEAQTKARVTLIIIGIIVLYIVYIMVKNSGVLNGTPTPPQPQEVQAVVQTIQNTTGVIVT